jgi:hypothetical protein
VGRSRLGTAGKAGQRTVGWVRQGSVGCVLAGEAAQGGVRCVMARHGWQERSGQVRQIGAGFGKAGVDWPGAPGGVGRCVVRQERYS